MTHRPPLSNLVLEKNSRATVSRDSASCLAILVVYPFCFVFILAGAYFSISTLAGFLTAGVAADWPKAEATITECEFKTNRSSEDTTYEVLVEFEYTVFGNKYKNDKIHPNYSSSSRHTSHRRLYDRLNQSTLVMTRYNPSDPSDSYLATDFLSSQLAELFVGFFFIIIGVFLLVVFHIYTASHSVSTAELEVVK